MTSCPVLVQTERLAITPCEDEADQGALLRLVSNRQIYPSLFLALRAQHGTAPINPQEWSCVRERQREDAPELVGALMCNEGVMAYCVHPDHWRRGHGLAMVAAACEAFGSASGGGSLRATVLRENRASVSILERCGFRFRGLHTRPWSDGYGMASLLAFERP